MAKLTSRQRDKLPRSDFAGKGRSYPMPDRHHAALAIGMAKRFAPPKERAHIIAEAKRRFPGVGDSSRSKPGRSHKRSARRSSR